MLGLVFLQLQFLQLYLITMICAQTVKFLRLYFYFFIIHVMSMIILNSSQSPVHILSNPSIGYNSFSIVTIPNINTQRLADILYIILDLFVFVLDLDCGLSGVVFKFEFVVLFQYLLEGSGF